MPNYSMKRINNYTGSHTGSLFGFESQGHQQFSEIKLINACFHFHLGLDVTHKITSDCNFMSVIYRMFLAQ